MKKTLSIVGLLIICGLVAYGFLHIARSGASMPSTSAATGTLARADDAPASLGEAPEAPTGTAAHPAAEQGAFRKAPYLDVGDADYFYIGSGQVLLCFTPSPDDPACMPVEGADPDTFVVLEESEFGMFEKDSRHVYAGTTTFSIADAASFKLLSWAYAVDKNHVYTLHGSGDPTILEGVDLATFEPLANQTGYDREPVFARDRTHFICGGTVHSDINPDTAHVVVATSGFMIIDGSRSYTADQCF